MRCLLLLILVSGVVSQSKVFRSRRIGTEGQVVSRLLSDYDANTRPPVRGCVETQPFILCYKDSADHSAILVLTTVFINRVSWKQDSAEVDLYLRQQWEDNRLQYEVDPREDIQEVPIPINRKIWKPDTYFSSGNEISTESRSSAVVEPSGYVRASEQRTVNVPVKYGSSFPFINRKSFSLRLSSYNYRLEDVVYLWANSPPLVNPVEVSSSLLNGKVVFEEASAGDCVGNYTVGVYSCIDVTVTFSSSVFGSLCIWFLPTILLVVSSWLHFWIHGSWSVPRTISAALPFFIFVALFVFRRDVVASSGGISCWLTFCLFLTFLSLIEYFIVICCGMRRSIRYGTNGNPEEQPIGSAKQVMEVAYDQGCTSFRNNNGIDIISRVLFPLLFIIFLIVYFIFLV